MHRCISGLLVAGLVCLGAASAKCADDVPLPPPPAPPAPAVPAQPPEADETPAAPAPPAPPDTSPAAPAAAATGGFAGRIVNGRVNIRSGPSTRFEIVVTLNPGAAVKVYGQRNGWYQIAYPENQHCYVHQRYIQGDIVDIPQEGLLRSVNGREVKVRVRPWNKSTAVGALKQGDLVTVVGIRGRWAKIKPPASARAWVFGKYVKTEGEAGPADTTTPAPAPPDHDGAKQAAAVKPKQQQQEKSRLAKLAEEKKRRYFEMLARRDAEERRKRMAAIKRVYDDINARLAAIEREEQAEATSGVVPPPAPDAHAEPPAAVETAAAPAEAYKPGERDMGGFTGWVEYIGRVGKRPAAFRLVKGGEVFFLLRSSKFNLAEYVNRRVAVDGTVQPAPGFQANVLEVTSLRLLDSPPLPVRAQKVKIRRSYIAPKEKPTAPPPAPAASDGEDGAKPAGGETTGGGSRLPKVENEVRLVPVTVPADGATKQGGDVATGADDRDGEAGKRERVFTPGK